MLKTVIVANILAAAFIGFIGNVKAAETKEVTRTVTIYSLSDNPKFEAAVKAICSDKTVKLSDKAKTICVTGEFPKLTKALRFRNAGVGAEFNTLAAQRSE